MRPRRQRLTIWTIGHSTRPLDELIRMLRGHGITLLVDVRTIPRSRRHPQYHREALAASLGGVGIGYVPMPGLGGLRTPRKDSTNTAWKNAGFRGYADYMQTPEFEANIDTLLEQARGERVAYMCAEAVPWRCHRSLLSDALTARGHEVLHIMTAERADPHVLTPFATVVGTGVSYPGPGKPRTTQDELPLGDPPSAGRPARRR